MKILKHVKILSFGQYKDLKRSIIKTVFRRWGAKKTYKKAKCFINEETLIRFVILRVPISPTKNVDLLSVKLIIRKYRLKNLL